MKDHNEAHADLSIFANLRERDLRAEGTFIAEGRILVDRLLRQGVEIKSVLCSRRFEDHYRELTSACSEDRQVDLFVREEAELQSIAGYAFHRGVLAAGRRPTPSPLHAVLEHTQTVVICSAISNAANLGSIYRSAVAFGMTSVVCDLLCGDELSRIALKSSMGASLMAGSSYRCREKEIIQALRIAGYFIVCVERDNRSVPARKVFDSLREKNPIEPNETTSRVAIVFGNEGNGLSEPWLDASDAIAEVPMGDELDSLNVAVTAGIVMYEFAVR